MAKRKQDTSGTADRTTATDTPQTTTADVIEERVVAFAAQLGRIAGSVHARAEGWLDRETLNQQITSVRDSAADLLTYLSGGARKTSKAASTAKAARGAGKGRSGGMVDAPGKKHRKPLPRNARELTAKSQADKMRSAKTRVKTNRLRGRG